jgi:hypothetical protein
MKTTMKEANKTPVYVGWDDLEPGKLYKLDYCGIHIFMIVADDEGDEVICVYSNSHELQNLGTWVRNSDYDFEEFHGQVVLSN